MEASLSLALLTTGMLPDFTQASTDAPSRVEVDRNFFAVSFSAWLAFEEIDRYWPGLPTVSLGSPLPPSTGGKFMKPSPPLATKSPPSAFWMPYDQEPCSIIAALPVYSSAWSALESAVIEE